MGELVWIVSTIATIFSLTGAGVMSLGKPQYMQYSALSYFIGSILWGTYGVLMGLWPLIILNVIFTMIEGRALYKWARGESLIEKPVIVVTADMQNAATEYEENNPNP